MGEENYKFFVTNCETFASWCHTDKDLSKQVTGIAAPFGIIHSILFRIVPVFLPPAVWGLDSSSISVHKGRYQAKFKTYRVSF